MIGNKTTMKNQQNGIITKLTCALFLLCTIGSSLILGGCGSGGSDSSSSTGTPTSTAAVVSGVAATGAPLSGTIYVKDSSVPSIERTTSSATNGSFSFDVTGLTPPFILKAQGSSGGTSVTLCSFAAEAGTANINPLSNALIANAARVSDPLAVYAMPTQSDMQTIANNLPAAASTMMAELKPLLDQYSGANVNPITAPFVANHTGLDAVLDAVDIHINGGNMVVANRQSNATIFTAPVNNLESGQINMANMPMSSQQPTGPVSLDGASLYASNCQPCHGALTSSNVRGTSSNLTRTAINGNTGGMGFLSTLTDSQIQAIVDALAITPAPTPTPAPTVDPGKTVYDTQCSGCHRLGSYDTSGSAPNLSGAGSKISGKYTAGVSGHKGKTLTSTEIANLKTFVNTH